MISQPPAADRPAEDDLEAIRKAGSHPILRAFPGGAIIAFDADLRYLCAGGLGLADAGLTREMLEGNTIGEVFPPEVVQSLLPHYQGALAGKVSKLYVRYAGHEYLNQLGPLRDATGRIIGGLGFTHDVTDVRQSQRALHEESRRLRDAESIGLVGSWELDLRDQSVNWSDGIFELYGLEQDKFDGNYGAALNCIDPADRAGIDEGVRACAETGVPLRGRYRITRASDGQRRWIDTRGEAQYEDGVRVRIVGAIADVTDHVVTEVQVRDDQAFQRAVIEASPDIIFVYDLSTRSMTWSNRSQLEVLGYRDSAPAGISPGAIDQLIPAAERAGFDAALTAVADSEPGEVVQVNHRLRAADGTDRWFSRRMTAFQRHGDGHVVQLVGILRDITEAVEAEHHLRHSAMHDNLTGLPNRALLMDRLDGALTRMGHSGREISVMFCDVDGFKRINDTAGHGAGDHVLLQVARRLQGAVRDGDTVARIGGDEFVVVIEPWNRNGSDHLATSEEDRATALRIADRIRDAVRQPIPTNGVDHVVSLSIGIAFGQSVPPGQSPAVNATQLLQDADVAMYRAKGSGKDRFEVFEATMRTDSAERVRVEQTLRRALRDADAGGADAEVADARVADAGRAGAGGSAGVRRARLSAAYQPIFSVTGALTGIEALARLTDAQGSGIQPASFIPIAEEIGLIGSIDIHVMDIACRQLARWRAERAEMVGVVMSVNVSAVRAQHSSLAEDVHLALTRHHLSPADLMLELTETALLDAAHSTIASLRILREEGIGIAIDDFGTGYASLRYLATLPISMLKVDKSFTAGLPDDPTCRTIVSAVAGLAADLSLICVVEGVETVEQQAFLPKHVQLQGPLLGRPQAAEDADIDSWLAGG